LSGQESTSSRRSEGSGKGRSKDSHRESRDGSKGTNVTTASDVARKAMDLDEFLESLKAKTFKKVCKYVSERKLGDTVGE
jgi:hypothetical protein